MTRRKRIGPAQQRRLLAQNADRCCVCKERHVGLHLHHLDQDPSNNVDDNIAVLCVRDHDRHHRPGAYALRAAHLELGRQVLRARKLEWESFVAEARSPNPRALATINMFGARDAIHSAKLVLQWADGRIAFEKSYHLLVGDFQYWADDMVSEVESLGSSALKIALVDEPLSIEYCSCGGGGMSSVVNAHSP